MTDDYKKILLDYITNLTPGKATSGETFQSVNEVARSEWDSYLPDGWEDFTLEGAIKSNSSDVIVFYGGYVEYNGTFADNSKGIIIITDNLLNPLQTIYEYDTGTPLRPITCMMQEEDGQFVAVDSKIKYLWNATVGPLFLNCEKRFIMLNDLSISLDNTYYVKLRKSYILGSNYTNFACRDIYKNPNSSHYFMAGSKLDTSSANYSPRLVKVIDLVINVGSANQWSYTDTATSHVYGGSYCYFDNSDNAQWKVLISPTSTSNYAISYWYGTNGSATGTTTIIQPSYKTYIDETTYYCQSVFVNENLAYFVLTNQNWGTSGEVERKYIGLYSYNFSTSTLNQIYLKYLGDYDYCDLEQIQLQSVNGELYIEYITNIDINNYTADYYVQRYEGLWNPILVKETGKYRQQRRGFYVSQDFNLLKIYCIPANMEIAWQMIDITEIYSQINYNGQSYEDYNSLIGEYGNVYSNGELVFSRDLYNISITNNYTVSTVEIPNTYLNGVSLSPKDLIGKTNVNLVNDTPNINKNIYEVLFLNYINTINVIDNEQDIIESTGKYINTNINVGTETNQSNSKCGQVFITWADSTTKNFPIEWVRTDDTHAYIEFTFYVEQDVESIELTSNDLTTTYITLDTSNTVLETGKYYTFKQYLKVE